MTEISVKHDAGGRRFALVLERYNPSISGQLERGTRETLIQNGASQNDILTVKVPRTSEIPIAAKKLAECGRFDAVICLGAIISDNIMQTEYNIAEISKSISRISLDTGIPVISGLVAEENIEHSEKDGETPGYNSAVSAIEMVNLLREIEGLGSAGEYWTEYTEAGI